MVNDDAAPCDCGMDSVSLVSPVIDLSSSAHPALLFRVYHDGRPMNGRAFVETSTDGISWTLIKEIAPRFGVWQRSLVGLDPLANTNGRIRFRYDDGGDWGSGLAIDEVCIFDRAAHDLELAATGLGDPVTSPFNTTVRTQSYSFLPVEQQNGAQVALHVRNNGYEVMHLTAAHLDFTVDGTGAGSVDIDVNATLPSLLDTVLLLNPGWTHPTSGAVSIQVQLITSETDDAPDDNSGGAAFFLTAANTYGHMMGVDADVPEAVIGEQGELYSAGNRFEVLGTGGEVRGISVRLGGGTEPGAPVHALVLDGDLNVLSVSSSYTITQADIDLSFSGGLVYIPLDSAVALDQDRDLIALMRTDVDTLTATLAASGVVAAGTAWKIGSDGIGASFPLRAPILRLNLSEPAVGVEEVISGVAPLVHAWPNPTHGQLTFGPLPPANAPWNVGLFDASGRKVLNAVGTRGGMATMSIDLGSLSQGCYTARLQAGSYSLNIRVIVTH